MKTRESLPKAIADTLSIKLSPRNSKLGYIWNVSGVPVADCINCDLCKIKCYARKAYRQYPATRAAWKQNSKAFRSDPDQAFIDLDKAIKVINPRLFRVHVAGDFFNQSHLDGYKVLAVNNPGTIFLAFTKSFSLNYSAIPDNLRIVLSMWPGQVNPDLDFPRAWVQDGTENRIPDNAIECPGTCDTCGMCWQLSDIGRDVFFFDH